MMKLFDGHCDVLYKMWKKKDRSLFFQHPAELQASYQRLLEGNIKVQTMAVFVPPEVPKELRHYEALQMIDLLHAEILAKNYSIQLLTTSEQLRTIDIHDDTLYILLSIEGADALQGDLMYLRTYYQLGVRSLGLTWNFRNEAAYGVMEKNPAGLSLFGYDLIKEMNHLGIAIDISHLAEKGFWEVLEHSSQPIMASHSNARALCEHPRNLYDDQIKAIFQSKGLIGINFVPYFLSNEHEATVNDVLKQIDYMLSLGGEDHIAFGSDFDGITQTVIGLEHSAKVDQFIQILQQHYSENIVYKMLFENWRQYYLRLW